MGGGKGERRREGRENEGGREERRRMGKGEVKEKWKGNEGGRSRRGGRGERKRHFLEVFCRQCRRHLAAISLPSQPVPQV